jgi:hypothetical protein
LRTFYRQKLLKSIAAQWIWSYSGSPKWFDVIHSSIHLKRLHGCEIPDQLLAPACFKSSNLNLSSRGMNQAAQSSEWLFSPHHWALEIPPFCHGQC